MNRAEKKAAAPEIQQARLRTEWRASEERQKLTDLYRKLSCSLIFVFLCRAEQKAAALEKEQARLKTELRATEKKKEQAEVPPGESSLLATYWSESTLSS